MQFSAVRKPDRIDDQMVVDPLVATVVESVQMRGDQHLVTGEKTLGKFPTDGVRRFGGNPLFGGKRLRVLRKPDAGRFAEPMLGQKEFPAGGLPAAMNSGKVLSAVPVNGFLFLRHIADDRLHGGKILRGFADKITGRHRLAPLSGRSVPSANGQARYSCGRVIPWSVEDRAK